MAKFITRLNFSGLLTALSLTASSAASAGPAPTIYHCNYHIAEHDGKSFDMSGNIILSDVSTSANNMTYLTLEPVEASRVDVSARILISYWTDNGGYYYNPMTLHARGDTSKVLASAELKGNGQLIAYTDEAGSSYTLLCTLRE